MTDKTSGRLGFNVAPLYRAFSARVLPFLLGLFLCAAASPALAQDDVYEPNDTRSTAYNLSPYEGMWLSQVRGEARQRDDDFYRILVPADETLVRVEVSFSHFLGDIDVQLQSLFGTVVGASETASSDEVLEVDVRSPGEYFIYVYYGNRGNPYDLRWTVGSASAGDDAYEPNDTRGEAYDLAEARGTWLGEVAGLGRQYDDDWYRIYVEMPSEEVIAERKRQAAPRLPDGPRPKIVGGVQAPQGAYPWMVALVDQFGGNRKDQHFCGGSLIAPTFVLTAAHCLDDTVASEVDVIVGAWDLGGVDGERIPVVEIIMHPGFDPVSLDNDIALIRLAYPPENPSYIPVIGMGDPKGLAEPGVTSRALGWGSLTSSHVDFPEKLRQVDVPVVSDSVVRAVFDPGEITRNMLGAGLREGGRDTCQGDSGGPLVVPSEDGESWVQAGITSWGRDCGAPQSYGIYTRLENYGDWIESAVGSPFSFATLVVDCTFSDPLGDIDLEIYDNQGSEIAASISTTDNEGITATIRKSGDYFIRVHHGNQGNSYNLRWDYSAPDPPLMGVSKTELLFSYTPGGDDTETQEITLTNEGMSALIVNASINSLPARILSIQGDSDFSLAGGETGTLTLEADYSQVSSGVTTGELVLATNEPGEVTLPVTISRGVSTFEAWLAARGVASTLSPTEDSDLDGMSNLLEYAFNTQGPATPERNVWAVPEIRDVGGSDRLMLVYPERLGATDIIYTVELSKDMENWTTHRGLKYPLEERGQTRLVGVVLPQDGSLARLKVTLD